MSLEPAAIWRFPAEGGAELLAADVSSAARFCLAGDSLFYPGYEDGRLMRCDLSTGEISAALPDRAFPIAAADGFIYYTKADGLYRNDSTMTAEQRIGPAGALSLAAEGDTLCILAASEDGSSAAVGWTDRNGNVLATCPLPETADTLLYVGGTAYVPQREAGCVLALAPDGTETARLPLPVLGAYVILWYADGEALYYETLLEEDLTVPIVRLPLDGSEGEIVAYVGG